MINYRTVYKLPDFDSRLYKFSCDYPVIAILVGIMWFFSFVFGLSSYIPSFEDYNAKVTRYLFVYSNGGEDRIHISEEVSSFADAVVELMNAVGDNCDLFMKSLKGMDSVQDIVDLFNHFSMYSIHSYYMVGDING